MKIYEYGCWTKFGHGPDELWIRNLNLTPELYEALLIKYKGYDTGYGPSGQLLGVLGMSEQLLDARDRARLKLGMCPGGRNHNPQK